MEANMRQLAEETKQLPPQDQKENHPSTQAASPIPRKAQDGPVQVDGKRIAATLATPTKSAPQLAPLQTKPKSAVNAMSTSSTKEAKIEKNNEDKIWFKDGRDMEKKLARAIAETREPAWPRALALAGATVLGLAYLQVVVQSKEKWFHFLLIAVFTFGGIQTYQFYQNQQQLDNQIDKYRRRTKNISSLTSSRESSQVNSNEDRGEESEQTEAMTSDQTSPSQKGIDALPVDRQVKSEQDKGTLSAKSSSTFQDSPIEIDPNNHQREMTERLEQISNQLKEHAMQIPVQANFQELSLREKSSVVEEEFVGKSRSKDDQIPITRICLTGGPCAGKTTALAELDLVLKQMGYRVLVVPEAATILKKGGALIQTGTMKFANAVKFQKNLMKLQMDLEEIFIDVAKMQDTHVIILFDRGVMDGSAYTHEDVWQAILDETGWSTIQLRDKRYEAVVHMITAAQGAEEFYSQESNAARYESIEQAREIDRRLIEAWVGHPQFNIVKNTKKGFKMKIDYVLKKVLSFIGMPFPTSLTRKYLLVADKPNPEFNVPQGVKVETFQLEETFITTAIGQANILRKVGKNDAFTYSQEMRYEIKGEKIQKKRQIGARDYIELSENPDAGRNTVKKLRQCFIYERQYFMVETFLNIDHNPSILRIETTNETKKNKLPPFLNIVREVTNEDAYETQTMAAINYCMPEEDVQVIQQRLEEEREQQRSPSAFGKRSPTGGTMGRSRTDSRQSNEK